jgi:formate hydrogenlyase transcriptional activator
LVAIALNNSLLLSEVRRLNALLQRDNQVLQEQVGRSNQGKRYVASSESMRSVMGQLRKAAQTDVTVLIQGETGSGKEGIARLIHELSPRCANPFVTVDLGALQDSLVESELFGHVKGAFTGVV